MSISVLFVCLGNICRSPTAEGVFFHQLKQTVLVEQVNVDSAGTGGWHIGRSPDPRTITAAHKRGYDLSLLKARQVSVNDFEKFDYILAMDNANLADLRRAAPKNFRGHLGLFLAFARTHSEREVPDPYYGEGDGFEKVLDLIEDAAAGLLNHLQLQLTSSP